MAQEETKKDNSKHKKRYTPPIDFEVLINNALKKAEVPIGKLFIDKVDKKPFLRKMTVRTAEGKHFRMVIGRQELMTGYEMFIAILKAKYKEALKQPDKPIKHERKKTYGNKHKSTKIPGRARGNHHKPNNQRRMGRDAKRKSSNTDKKQS